MNHYKSWSGLNKQLTDCLCESLKDRITYFLTRYHDVHNSYGRASIRLEGKEVANFSWTAVYQQEYDVSKLWEKNGTWSYDEPELKEKWDNEVTFSDWDFLSSATNYLQLSAKEALNSEDYLVRVFAIMDKRIGKRTLNSIRRSGEYKTYPQWVQWFYELRLTNEIPLAGCGYSLL